MSTSPNKPTVLIVGAGLGGLMLGALLEKAGVPYTILERARVVKPMGTPLQTQEQSYLHIQPQVTKASSLTMTLPLSLAGSTMTVGPVLLAIFQQLGIYDDLLAIGKKMTHIKMHKESLQPYKPTDYTPVEEQ